MMIEYYYSHETEASSGTKTKKKKVLRLFLLCLSCASLAAAFYQMTFHMLAQLLWFWSQPDTYSEMSPDFLFHSSSLLKVPQPAKPVPFAK